MVIDAKTAPAERGRDEAERTLVDWFLLQVRLRGSDPALYFRSADRWASVTWGQFGQGSRRLSAFLVAEGVAEEEHAAIWSGNRPEWHIADAAILCARVRPVPVYLTLSASQAQYVLQHSETRVIFVENEALLARVLEVRDALPALRRIVIFDSPSAPADPMVLTWQQALDQGDAALKGHGREVDRRAATVQMDDVATLIYTSGTTGPPKAVLLTHRNLDGANQCLAPIVPAGEDDRVLSYLPLAHVAERLASEFRSYRYGNATWFLDSLPNLAERLRDVRPTMFFGVPRVWEKMYQRIQYGIDQAPVHRRLLGHAAIRTGLAVAALREAGKPVPAGLQRRHAFFEKLVYRKLRALLGLDAAKVLASGAAPISPDVLHFFAAVGLEILEIYGQTEDSAMTAMNRPGHARIGTVGQPLPTLDVKIADDGEILVKGPPVFTGYYKDDVATREALTEDGYLRTGDVGEFDADGYLRITDRKKDLIITAGGKNISPGNLQEALKQHRLVGNAVAIGDQRPYISALLTLDAEEAPAWARARGLPEDLADLARHETIRAELQSHVDQVNTRLSQVEQVKRFAVLGRDFEIGDELTPTMKVKRKVVAEKYRDQIEELYAKR